MKVLVGSIVAAALGLAASAAQSVTVTSSTELPEQITSPGDLPDPMVVSGFVRIDFAGNNFDGITPSALSPYYGTPFADTALYHSVSANSEAKYLFDKTQRKLSLVFGSPDEYNRLSFWLDGAEVFSLTGDTLVPAADLGTGALLVMIGDISFDEVRFASSGDAFEFSNIASYALAAIPLPAPLAMLLASLAGLGVLTRRRSAHEA